jgi:RND superfamily putative drug exporter
VERTGQLGGAAPRPARAALRAPRLFLALTLAAALIAAVFGASGLGRLSPFSADDPGSESVNARELIGEATGVDPDFGLIVLVPAPAGVEHPATRARARAVVRVLRAEPLVADVRSWYRERDPVLVAGDRRATYLVGGLRPAGLERQLDAARRVERDLEAIPGVKLGGRATFYAHGNDTAREDLVRAELLAFPLLLLLTLWVFRGLVAALLPLLVGAISVAGALGALRVVSLATDVSVYALNIVTALGLGLAVDYSLLLLSRYREEALATGYGREALGRALARTGRTVLFSSLTVAGAAAALLVFPQPFLRSIAIGGIFVALLAGAAALSVLPAALAVLGRRVEALSPRRWRAAVRRAARPADSGFWYRLSRAVMRRPGTIAAVTAALLLLLASPSLDIKTTAVDANVVPESSSDRQVAEAFARQGRTQPILIAAEPPAGTGRSAMAALARRVDRLAGIANVSEPQVLRRTLAGRDLWRVDALPAAAPLAKRSQQAVRDIRALELPYPIRVGGETASLVDLKQSLGERLPLAVLLLVALTCIPIFFATGSLVLPLKTILMNVLTVLATFGVLVVIFQEGRYEQLLGYTSSGALEASVLVLIFAVSFGLATDYGMFLLGRIKEERERGADNSEAVALGLERTGRVVTAAALLLCVALGSLVTAQHALVKEVGVGCALAVAIDATIVRALLVPSLMQLLGRFNWWAPPPLRALAGRGRTPAAPAPQPPGPGLEHLEVTRYCDWRHSAVFAAVAGVLDGDESDREAAVKLFRFVRDEILYEFGPWGVTASETLERRGGTCTNKANALVALLRAAGIPAAYGVLRVDAQRYWGPIGPDFLTCHASSDSTHIYAAAYIEGRWIRCDPSTDGRLASLTAHWNPQTRLIEWDGRSDALDFIDPAHIHTDLGLHANVDDLLSKPARNALPDLLEYVNDYLAFIRRNPPFGSAEALIGAYRRELEQRRQEQVAPR